MGSVYEGLQIDLGRRVAIKVLHTEPAPTKDALERFRREARAAAALGHPNIVQVTDFCDEALIVLFPRRSAASPLVP